MPDNSVPLPTAHYTGLKTAIAEGIINFEISNRNDRLKALQEVWNDLRAMKAARAADPLVEDCPGGKTGLVVRTVKRMGTGQDATLVEAFAIDTCWLREFREYGKQAAIESGQWQGNQEDGDRSAEIIQRLQAGRQRVEEAKRRREEAAKGMATPNQET